MNRFAERAAPGSAVVSRFRGHGRILLGVQTSQQVNSMRPYHYLGFPGLLVMPSPGPTTNPTNILPHACTPKTLYSIAKNLQNLTSIQCLHLQSSAKTRNVLNTSFNLNFGTENHKLLTQRPGDESPLYSRFRV